MTPHPQSLLLNGIRVADVRHLFPDTNIRQLPRENIVGIALHHDAVILPPGDRDFNGTTLDEDIARMQIIYRHAIAQDWARYPYHLTATPNGRLFYTLGLATHGSHVEFRNHELLGLVLLGNFMDHPPQPKQLCAAGAGVVALERYRRRLIAINGHRQWARPASATVCPGNTFPDWLDDLHRYAGVQARLHPAT